MSRARSLINRMGEDADLYNRALGARVDIVGDDVTNQPLVTWSDAIEIKIFVDEVQTREVDSVAAGRVTEKRMKAFCGSCDIYGDTFTISHMDRVTYHGEDFEVESTETPEYLYGNLQYRRVILVRLTE